MFEQYLGDGADLFITLFAIIAGFAAALGFMDFRKTKKNEPREVSNKES